MRSPAQLTIYDVGASFTWQAIHGHTFFSREEAEEFTEKVAGRWIVKPTGPCPYSGTLTYKVQNSAGCFVHQFKYSTS
jgi:hypothetical protein